VLRREDLALKSPGDGLPPYELDTVIGRTLRHPLAEDAAVMLEHLEEPLPGMLEPAGASVHADDER
jgi:N-acetylneuraminate synthase/sialic acid synthase